jgi:Lipase (class 3)
MSIANSTDSHKVARSATARDIAGPAFGDSIAHVSPIEDIAPVGPGAYDPELAYLMSVVSAWAYADEQALAAKLPHYGIQGAHVRRVSVQNDALLVVATAYLVQSKSGKVGVLAFRGTDPASFVTIFADGEVMQRPFVGHGVHAGFYSNVEAVWDDVSEALAAALQGAHLDEHGARVELPNKLERLYITGHSLGGAMAVLAAARLFGRGYEALEPKKLIQGVYTFGQPMVGDRGFADACGHAFGPKLFRHVFRADVVPHLPPKSGIPYAHTGREWRSDSVLSAWTGDHEASKRAPLPAAVFDVLLNAVELRFVPRALLLGYSIDDHMPVGYVDVSRYSIDPRSVAVSSAFKWRVPPLSEIPGSVGRAVTTLFGSGG